MLLIQQQQNYLRMKLEDLFQHGLSLPSALNILEMDMQMGDPEGFIMKCANRSCFPDIQFCYSYVDIHCVKYWDP